jgi:hypothetical protein
MARRGEEAKIIGRMDFEVVGKDPKMKFLAQFHSQLKFDILNKKYVSRWWKGRVCTEEVTNRILANRFDAIMQFIALLACSNDTIHLEHKKLSINFLKKHIKDFNCWPNRYTVAALVKYSMFDVVYNYYAKRHSVVRIKRLALDACVEYLSYVCEDKDFYSRVSSSTLTSYDKVRILYCHIGKSSCITDPVLYFELRSELDLANFECS